MTAMGRRPKAGRFRAAGESAGAAAVQVTEEAKRRCWEEQSDEVVALAAILEEAFEARGPDGSRVEPVELQAGGDAGLPVRPGELRLFFSVEVEVPQGGMALDLARARRGDGGSGEPSSSAQAAPQIYRVRHMPPVSLQVELPVGYPLEAPPKFWLVCLWLSPPELGEIRRALEGLWEREAAGGPVCFLWYEFLKFSVLDLLGFGGGELRVKARVTPDGEEVAVQLVEYNERRKHLAFCRARHLCGVCLEERLGAAMHILQPCGHHFCRTCIQNLCEFHVREGSIECLRCPEPSCQQELQPALLKRVLSDELFGRWEALSLQKALEAMSDMVYCPRCDAICWASGDDDSADCPKCFFSFCTLCRNKRHVGSQCMSPEQRLAILRAREQGRENEEKRRAKVKELENEVLAMKYVAQNAKRCPRCSVAIERSEGCNKMTCSNCQAVFCFICGKEVDGYNHFQGGSCMLFDMGELAEQNWVRDLNLQLDAAADFLQVVVPNGARDVEHLERWGSVKPPLCPNCGHKNTKVDNNNHIRCWACSSWFCALCLKVLKKGEAAAHYAPSSGCKQHTSD